MRCWLGWVRFRGVGNVDRQVNAGIQVNGVRGIVIEVVKGFYLLISLARFSIG